MFTQFPDKNFTTNITNPAVRIICAPTENDLIELIGSDRSSWQILSVSMRVGERHLALRGFKLREDQKTFSAGSDALYLASGDEQKGILVQYLRPDGKTSFHYHGNTTERFHLLVGHAVIATPWGMEFAFGTSSTIVIPPFTPHQVRTGEQDSLVLLEMTVPAGKTGGKKDHYYLDEAQLEQVRNEAASLLNSPECGQLTKQELYSKALYDWHMRQ